MIISSPSGDDTINLLAVDFPILTVGNSFLHHVSSDFLEFRLISLLLSSLLLSFCSLCMSWHAAQMS